MKIIEGNLIHMALDGRFDLIVHGCNCFNTMGAGFAKSVAQWFPEAYEADLKTVKGSQKKLGTYTRATVTVGTNSFVVVNAYTQYDYRGEIGVPRVDYLAIDEVFEKIGKNFSMMKIAYPKIGAGLAGGDWGVISEIIDKRLVGCDHTLVEYTGDWHAKGITRRS